jgi:hypothetical protein
VNRGHPLGIFTVLADHARGAGWLSEIKGEHQGVWALAVVDLVTREPADRLREALDQSRRRQGQRLGSTQPVQVWSLPATAPRKVPVVIHERDIGEPRERDIGEPRDFMDEHQAEMRHIPRYAQDRHGQGRWVRLFRFGGPIRTLWTDDAQALGFIPEPRASVALLVNSIRSAYAQGTPTLWVFDDHAARATRDHWAGPVERGDLANVRSG